MRWKQIFVLMHMDIESNWKNEIAWNLSRAYYKSFMWLWSIMRRTWWAIVKNEQSYLPMKNTSKAVDYADDVQMRITLYIINA